MRLFFTFLLILVALAGLLAYRWFRTDGASTRYVWEWLRNSAAHPDWAVKAGERCNDAPFILPTDGFIGFLWGDSFRPGHRHQGLDIFGGGDLNQTPVVAAYPGYLTRQLDWKATVIIRIPEDPLRPGRQIWTYYTHMADQAGNSFISPEFPPGTREVFIEAGTLLGHQGNYSGDPGNPVGTHLHFSIVLDDGQGHYRNELEIENTLDPSPYLGLPVNASQNRGQISVCPAAAKGE
jgi:peptidoglycan LD-endopeptidase LytH